MEKKYRYFTECYKHYTGKLWDWEEDGNPEESDAYTRGLYHGFKLARKGQDELKATIDFIQGTDFENQKNHAGDYKNEES